MKKLLLPLLLLLLINFQGFAQLKLGIQAGINASKFAYSLEDKESEKDFKDNIKYKVGYSFGALADYQLGDILSLQSGLVITNKGTSYKKTSTAFGYTYEQSFNANLYYVELPVHAACQFRNFQVQAGPYLGLGVKGKSKEETIRTGKGEETTNEQVNKVKFMNSMPASFAPERGTDYVRRLAYGLDFGVGYKAGPALIRATYSLGLSNLPTEREGTDTANTNKITSRGISLSVAYFIL